MRYNGMGPGNPSQQGPGGMAPPMNPMQKSGMQGMQPPQPMQNQSSGQQGGAYVPPWMQAQEANGAANAQLSQDIMRLEDQLRQATMSGANPMMISGLQAQLQRLQQQQQQSVQRQMLDSRQQAFNQERRAGAPGIGGATNPNSGLYTANSGFDQQLLGLILGGGMGMTGGGPGMNQ